MTTPAIRSFCVALLGGLLGAADADPRVAGTVHGVWRDPTTGVDVEVHACEEARELLCGRIVRLPPRGPTTDVHNAEPARRQRPLLGLEIVSAFEPVAADRWQGGGEYGRRRGRIYLPVNGDTLGDHRHRYEIRLDADRLLIGIANCRLLNCLGQRAWQRVGPP